MKTKKNVKMMKEIKIKLKENWIVTIHFNKGGFKGFTVPEELENEIDVEVIHND